METNMATSIIDHFSFLSDPRILLKVSHKLIDMVVIALCTVISGADDWVEIADYGRLKQDWFSTFLELPNGVPSHDTFGRVFSRIDPEQFGKCLTNWIQEAVPRDGFDIIAIDGKTARRSHDRANEGKAMHMVNAWAVKNRLVLGQVKTDDKSNEITAIPELLKLIDVKGCVVTIDAMGCQKEIAKQIVEQGGDYVLALKGNQGNLHNTLFHFQSAQ